MIAKLVGHIRRAVLFAFAFFGVAAYGFNKTMYPYTLPAGRQGAALGCVRAEKGMQLELGKWYTNFSVCKEYADANGIPLVAVWSNQECIHCWYLDVCFIQEEFITFQQTEDAGKVIYCFMAGGDETLDQVGSAAYNWMYTGGGARLDAYPFVVLWWKAGNVNHRTTGDVIRGRLGMTEKNTPASTQNVIAKIRSVFSAWKPAKCPGGTFDFEPSEGNRFEAEASTESITFSLVRDSGVASVVTNSTVKLLALDGTDFLTTDVAWNVGETNQIVTISLKKDGDSLFNHAQNGDVARLLVTDADGNVISSNSVTYVDRPVSAHNPLWIGERSVSATGGTTGTVPELAFGEWTMDLNVATQKVAATEGEAFTLVLVSGSLWCPDCTKTGEHFLDVTSSDGENLFNAWAKSNSVALVEIDVPSFTNEVGMSKNPSLLIREGRVRGDTVKSGLGYLTRKGATEEEAMMVLERNHKLVSTPTAHGGFNRAENNNPLRTGVPMFVMLRKDGTVAARLTRWWSVAPTSSNKWNAYINRFDEMVEMARMHSDHADDIENNHATTTSNAIAANGGRGLGEISHCDPVDVFKLEGVGGNALQRVHVRGVSDVANAVTVEYFRVVDGVSTPVGKAVSGSLTEGISLENVFTETGDYYVAVKGNTDSDDGLLGVESTVKGNFLAYEISCDVVFVPQQVQATGRAPETTDKVIVRLKKGLIYRIDGLKEDALSNRAFVAVPSTDGEPLFRACVSDDVELTVAGGNGGTLTYQTWNRASDIVKLSRYVMSSNLFAISEIPSGRVTFAKKSGVLPTGLKVAYAASENAMLVYGIPTAKAGTYEVIYQIKEGNGFELGLTFVVCDPTSTTNPDGSVNDDVNASVTIMRTFSDIPVCDDEERRLVGTLRLTIPPKGTLSAKYVSRSGQNVSFSTRSWDGFDAETKTLRATLTAKAGYVMHVDVEDSGAVMIEIYDPEIGKTFVAETDANSAWGRKNTAEAWKGYYTVALPVVDVVEHESRQGLASRGTGYLTLKMDTASAWNLGKVKWAGMLPNGTSVSGSTVLTYGIDWALLPILKTSAMDVLSVLAKIKTGGYSDEEARSVLSADGIVASWAHMERDEAARADYEVELDVFGGPYNDSKSLAVCCQDAYETTSPILNFVGDGLTTNLGELGAGVSTVVTVEEKRIFLSKDAPSGLTLSLNRRTGIVTGKVRLPYEDGRYVSANWKGVLLQGWGVACSECSPGGDDIGYRPFINGSFYFTDTIEYEEPLASGKVTKKTLRVKRGGDVYLQ